MPDSLIHFDRVTKSYRTVFGRPRDPVFTDVSLHLGEHEIIGLAGPSGCGKSTLIRMFLGLTEWQGGRIRYRGTDLARVSRRDRRLIHREVQVVFQDPHGAFNPRWRLRRSVTEPLRVFRIRDHDQTTRVTEQLSRLGLEDGVLDRYPHQLSGGQLQRLALARCLLVRPRCLLLDEASAMLDLSVQAQMMALIRQLHEQQGISVLLISHDEDLVAAICQRSYRFVGGQVKETG
jgi:nickel import ATP-binding protein nikE